jgi:hypothetical protein
VLISTAQQAVTRQMIEGTNGLLIPRGLAYPLDPFLLGTVRHGRKLGFEYAMLVPDNRWRLAEDAVYLTDRFILDDIPQWLRPGDYISIGLREMHRVVDISDETVMLATRIMADHDAGTYVYHYSSMAEVEGAYQVGQTNINVDLPVGWFCVPGDVISILYAAGDLFPSFVHYNVVTASLVGSTSATSQWFLTLDQGLHRALADAEEIQLRAYPAYQSRALKVPQAGVALVGVVGPYLLDWTSVPFLDGPEVYEHQTVQYLDDTLVPVESPFMIQKNAAVMDAPIRADQFFFWDLVAGDLNYDDTLGRVLGSRDAAGWWWIKSTMAPAMEIPVVAAAGMIITVAPASLVDNDYFLLTDDLDTQRIEYQVTAGYVATAETPATGAITVGAIPVDNDTLVVDNGLGTVVIFEFQATGAFISANATYRIIDVQAAALPTDVAVAIETAVMAVRAVLGISAVNVGPVVNLTHDTVTTRANVPLAITGAWLGAPLAGMTGGSHAVETVDVSSALITTAIQVAALTAAAVNRSGLHITAHATATAPSIALVSTVPGPAGNQPIQEFVLAPGFLVSGMSGGFGGRSWSFTIKSESAALLRVRFYPNAWQDFNLVAAVDTPVAVQLLATDQPVERIDILVASVPPAVPGGEIQMTDWGVSHARIRALRHTYVAHVQGGRTFACTGMWAKPVWRSLDDLKLPMNGTGALNSGFAMV